MANKAVGILASGALLTAGLGAASLLKNAEQAPEQPPAAEAGPSPDFFVPELEVALQIREDAFRSMGATCVIAIERQSGTDIEEAVNEILDYPDKPCGQTWGEVNHNVVVARTVEAGVAFAEAQEAQQITEN